MKRVILLTLTALLLISSMTACGSRKSDTTNKGLESRVLYPDDDSSEENEVDKSEADEISEDEESKSEENDTVSEESETSSEQSDDEKSTENDSSSKTTSSKKNVTTSSKTSSTNNSSHTSSQNNSSKPESSHSDNDTTDTNIPTDTDTDQEVIGSFDESDFVVTFYGCEINFGDDIDDVIAILGERYLLEEVPSCKYDDQSDKTFIFEECSINTYPNEDGSVDYVVGIVITNPDFETAKGIRIGTPSEDLIAIYGYSESDDSDIRRYTIGDRILSFYIEGDMVTEIHYIWDN